MAGVFCLLASLVLLSPGVRTVRAEAGEEALVSVAPALDARAAAASVPEPVRVEVARDPNEPVAPSRAVVAGPQVAPGVVVLNTRGYNYGPRQREIDPGAMR